MPATATQTYYCVAYGQNSVSKLLRYTRQIFPCILMITDIYRRNGSSNWSIFYSKMQVAQKVFLTNLFRRTRSPLNKVINRSLSAKANTESEDMEDLKKNPHYAKYAEKIKKLEQ